MPEELTSRQWRALATVYDLYAPAQRDADSGDAEEIAQAALPLLQRAFPSELISEVPAERKRRREQPTELWRRHIPAPIDAYLSRLLCVDSVLLSGGERRLLRLLSREQRRRDEGEQRDAELRQRVRRVAEKLNRLAGDDETPGGLPDQNHNNNNSSHNNNNSSHNNNNSHNSHTRGKSKSNMRSVSEGNSVVAAPPLQQLMTKSAQSKPAEAPAPTLAIKSPAAALVSAPVVDFTCAGCEESGGELFQCRRCLCLRHEACGGPMMESETGFCAMCCHELGLSVSASSLRQSTSTEERMDDEEENDTSLSGFIVDTDEGEDGSEGSESSSSSSSTSSSHVTPPKRRRKKAKRNA